MIMGDNKVDNCIEIARTVQDVYTCSRCVYWYSLCCVHCSDNVDMDKPTMNSMIDH